MLTPAEMEVAKEIDKGKNLFRLFASIELTVNLVDHIIEKKGHSLAVLFYSQDLTGKQIDLVIKNGKYLHNLYRATRQILSSEQKARIEKILYPRSLSEEEIRSVIDYAVELSYLYRNVKLNEELIDYALEKGMELTTLFRFQILSSSNIENALSIKQERKSLASLLFYQNLDNRAKRLIYEKIQKRDYL